MKMWYVGVRWAGQYVVKIRSQEDLPIRHDIRHLADSFQWGNHSPGALQLALALLIHRFGARMSGRYYLDFAREVVAKLSPDAWRIDAEYLDEWMTDHHFDQKQLEQGTLPFEQN